MAKKKESMQIDMIIPGGIENFRKLASKVYFEATSHRFGQEEIDFIKKNEKEIYKKLGLE